MVSREKGIQIRTEIFDHGIFPCPSRLNTTTILNLVRTLYQQSSSDGKITAQQWAEAAINLLSLSLHEAQVYFEVFRNLAYERKPSQLTVDVKPFCVYLTMQMFSTATTRISLENASSLTSKFNTQQFPGFGGTFPSPQASPRSKAIRGFLFTQASTDYQMALQFVKSNLRLLLKILSVDMQSPDLVLTAADFNCLQIILVPVDGPQVLSKLYPGFQGGQRCYSDQILQWLNRKLVVTSQENLQVFPDIVFATNLNRGVIIKKEEEWDDKDVRIANCQESYIYIDASVRQVSMVNCRETTVFVAAARKIITMDKCEVCQLTAAANLIRVGNSVDCVVNLYSPWVPVLFGDNRGLVVGPFNAFYPGLPQLIERSNILLGNQNQKCLQNWYTPIEMNTERTGHCFTDMMPKDFFRLVLPSDFHPQNPEPLLTPEEFVKALGLKEDYFQAIQKMIANSGLNEEQEKRLHLAIQGYFREWLVSSGNIKGPLELVRMIDQEN